MTGGFEVLTDYANRFIGIVTDHVLHIGIAFQRLIRDVEVDDVIDS
jgi:hypothetical protein